MGIDLCGLIRSSNYLHSNGDVGKREIKTLVRCVFRKFRSILFVKFPESFTK